MPPFAEIITLRAIALKLKSKLAVAFDGSCAEIITLRAIALKHFLRTGKTAAVRGRDHNATSYSTETSSRILVNKLFLMQRS